jgi:hypothetical protein
MDKMTDERYQAILKFMNGRDVSSSYSDPAHKSEYNFEEFNFVYLAEKAIKDAEAAKLQPVEEVIE